MDKEKLREALVKAEDGCFYDCDLIYQAVREYLAMLDEPQSPQTKE